MQVNNTQGLIAVVCDEVKQMLLQKNADYGNSFAYPLGVFSSLTPTEEINVRIDDKLKRIRTGRNEIAEDTELDIIGYLILKRVLGRMTADDRPV